MRHVLSMAEAGGLCGAKAMIRNYFSRLTAIFLSCSLLIGPAAQALTVEQAADLLKNLYVDEVPESVLSQPSVEEMLNALGDPYTQYFTPQEYVDFIASMSDTSLVGIGVTYRQEEDGLHIDEVLKGYPAESGGLQAGDIITKVDGNSVIDVDTDTVTGWIRGEIGTNVQITYLRGGVEATVTLQRAQVVVAATTGTLLDDHIGYIRCTTFGNETVGHFQELMEEMSDRATAWIVDLRGNTGGVTDAAVGAASLFAGGDLSRPMVYFRRGNTIFPVFQEIEQQTLYPVIVLVDPYTASASEIFSSAIRDYGCGIVVGTRTYGKGVAQVVIDESTEPDYFPDGDAVKITSYRFYSPAGNTTDRVGVIPDLLLSPAFSEDEGDLTLNVARLLAGSDPLTDTSSALRLDLGWRFHIDRETAAKPENRAAFQALLDAIPDNKNLWAGTGGTTGWEKISVQEAAELFGLTYHAPRFPDQNDSNYVTPLSILKTYHLVRGKDDGLYHPEDNLTRAELCQLLAGALNCSIPANTSNFTDVPADAWYAPAVTAMSNLSLIQGTGDGQFRPNDLLDHQQLITIMARLAQFLNRDFYRLGQDLPEEATNIVAVMRYDDWAKSSVWMLGYSQTGLLGNPVSLLWEDGTEIDPVAPSTRDEAAALLYQILSYLDILPA